MINQLFIALFIAEFELAIENENDLVADPEGSMYLCIDGKYQTWCKKGYTVDPPQRYRYKPYSVRLMNYCIRVQNELNEAGYGF